MQRPRKFHVAGSKNRYDVIVQPSRSGKSPVRFKNQQQMATLFGLSSAGEVPEIFRTAHDELLNHNQEQHERKSPCLRSPDPTQPVYITSANCLLCQHYSSCKEETARRLGQAGLTVSVESNVSMKDARLIQRAIQHLPTQSFPNHHPFEILGLRSNITAARLIHPPVRNESLPSSSHHIVYSSAHGRTLSNLEARWLHELELLDSIFSDVASGSQKSQYLSIKNNEALLRTIVIARAKLAEIEPSDPGAFHRSFFSLLHTTLNDISRQNQPISSGVRPPGFFEFQKTPSIMILHALKYLHNSNGHAGSGWPLRTIDKGAASQTMHAMSREGQSLQHSLVSNLLGMSLDLWARNSGPIRYQDVFGRRLATLLFLPIESDEEGLIEKLHARLRPIRSVRIDGLTHPLLLVEDDPLLEELLASQRDSDRIQVIQTTLDEYHATNINFEDYRQAQPNSKNVRKQSKAGEIDVHLLLAEIHDFYPGMTMTSNVQVDNERRRMNAQNGIYFPPEHLIEAVHVHHQLSKYARLRPAKHLRKQKSSLQRVVRRYAHLNKLVANHLNPGNQKLNTQLDGLETLAFALASQPDHAYITLDGMLIQLRNRYPELLDYKRIQRNDLAIVETETRELRLFFTCDKSGSSDLNIRGEITKDGTWDIKRTGFDFEKFLLEHVGQQEKIEYFDREIRAFTDAVEGFVHLSRHVVDEPHHSETSIQGGLWLSRNLIGLEQHKASSLAAAVHGRSDHGIAFVSTPDEVDAVIRTINCPCRVHRLDEDMMLIDPVQELEPYDILLQIDPF